MAKTRISPVIRPVIASFKTVYYQTTTFSTHGETSAINGLLVMGDAGTGKSHFVKQALRDAGVQKNVEYIKGGTITAAALYVKLYLNRDPDRIIVIDDVDILQSGEIKSKIVPMLLGAVEEGKNRQVTWSTARANSLMEEHNVPMTFNFNGNIILITNYTLADIDNKLASFKQAFRSRFTPVECIFTHEQKYLYTKYLVENEDMLGKKCKVHEYEHKGKMLPGYPEAIIEQTMDFIDENYMSFTDITPRVCIKIADTIMYHKGEQQEIMLDNLVK